MAPKHRQRLGNLGLALLTSFLVLLSIASRATADSDAGKTLIATLVPNSISLGTRDSHIDPNVGSAQEQLIMKLPTQYTDDNTYGVVVYLGQDDQLQGIPPEWDALLDQHKLIFVAPLHAGKDVLTSRRLGLAVISALYIEHYQKIDQHRVYVTGYGDAARLAGLLGFFAPDLFTGSIQMCGADFYKPVPQVEGKPAPGETTPYGLQLSDATAVEMDAAKSFRFAFITDRDDPHRGQIADIVNGGYAREGFQSKLFDIPGVDQGLCSSQRLSRVLDYLQGIQTAPTTEPAPPAWMARDPGQWPRILLSNRLTGPDGGGDDVGSSSLTRLPNGAVVLCTARHLLGDAGLSEFPKLIKSWITYADSVDDGVRMTRVAMDLGEPTSFDGLILCSNSQADSWPGTVLPIRQEPLEIGETVYLVAVPSGSRDRQDVFKGIIIGPYQGYEMQYNVDGDFDTMGCSGAPVIDQYGRLAAINVGHLLTQSIPGKKQLVCIATSEVLKKIKLPADVHPVQNASAQSSPSHAPASPADLANQQASAALRHAQLLIANQVYDKARSQLQAIIDTYPTTAAAAKARDLLAKLPSPP
jgi:hypothetical protein